MITFACDCGKRLNAREEIAGRKTKCPACGQLLTIPSPGQDAERDLYALADPPPTEPPAEDAFPARSSGPARTWHQAPPIPESKPKKKKRTEPAPGSSAGEFVYFALALALIPLAISLLQAEKGGFLDRLERRLKAEPPEVAAKVNAVIGSGTATMESLLDALPGRRLDDEAHLARDSIRHWLYAAIASALFLGLAACCFRQERVSIGHLAAVGLFTGTIGILFLIAVQYAAAFSGGVMPRGRGIAIILILIVKFIGFSYQAALGDTGFLLSFLGFTCGVGLCEELCKALPLLGYYRRDAEMGWRGACLWGLASGIGFGISEGIMYSGDHYNGVSGPGIYVVRFVSCVALHAMWSASVGISIWRRQDSIQGDLEWHEFGLSILRILLVPMILHGLYDTLLKKDMNALALGVAAFSFAWLAWQVESARGESRSAAFA